MAWINEVHKELKDLKGKWVFVIIGILIGTLFALSSCSTIEKRADSWDLENTVAEVAWQGLHLWDRDQTMEIAHHPDRYHELNGMMPRHPSEKDVNEFFVWTGLLHPTVSFLLPDKYRPYWQYISIGTKAGTVFWNIQVMH